MMKQYYKDFFKNYDDINFVNWCIRLNNTLQNLFVYKNVPETLNTFFLENYLHLYPSGVCALINDDKFGIIAVKGDYGTDVDVYGLGTKFVGANCKKSYSIDINDDNIVMCHNNVTMTSDIYLIEKYAMLLNEIDKSLNTNIVYSRVYPIPLTKSKNDYNKITQLLKAIFKGEIGKIASTDIDINDLVGNTKIDILNLTDGNQSSHIETLIRLKDNVLKMFLREIGINVNTVDKSAQVNNTEVQAFITYSNLNLVDYYNSRKDFISRANEKFGLSMEIEYNENLMKQIFETTEKTENIDNDEERGAENENKEMVGEQNI